jgi:hypothetical protein
MNTLAVIDGLCSGVRIPGGGIGGISKRLLEQLCAIYPEGRTGSQGHCFRSTLPVDDARTGAILYALKQAGMRPWKSGRERDNTRDYFFELQRIYDPSDLDACEFLELTAQGDEVVMKGEPRLEGRTVAKIGEPGKADICMLGICSCTYITVQRARDALEAANLKGLKFLPVEKSYESIDYDLYDEEDTWWELESDIELPPLAPSMTLETRDGKPFRGDFTEGCIRREGFYTHPELHYRRADLERIGPFDAARTYEHFHPRGPAPLSRAFVVSQNFYRVCRNNGIKTRFVPVRIDNE